MMFKVLIIALVFFQTPHIAFGQIYRCEGEGGNVTYADQPCSQNIDDEEFVISSRVSVIDRSGARSLQNSQKKSTKYKSSNTKSAVEKEAPSSSSEPEIDGGGNVRNNATITNCHAGGCTDNYGRFYTHGGGNTLIPTFGSSTPCTQSGSAINCP